MFNRTNNRRAVENFLVSKRGTTVYNSAGNSINTSNGSVLLADGQLGFFDASGMGSNNLNRSLAAATTVVQSPIISIVQGNENSAQPWVKTAPYPLWNRPYETSHRIVGQGIQSVTKQVFTLPSNSTWIVGAVSGPSAITATRQTEYSLKIGFTGKRMEEFYSLEESYYVHPTYTTPDYTALSTAEPVDDLLQNLAYDVNSNSQMLAVNYRRSANAPVIALLIDHDGGAGTVIGDIAAGTFLPLMNTTSGVKGIYPDQGMVNSIKAAATAAGLTITGVGAATVLTLDLTTAGTTTGGVAKMLMLVATDSTLAYQDYGYKVKNALKVGLSKGFDYTKVYNKELSFAKEGEGAGKVWDKIYRATQGQRKYNLNHAESPVIEFPSPVDTTESYTVYSIEHVNVQDLSSTSGSIEYKLKDFILVPTNAKGVENSSANAQETAIEAFLNPYLASAGKSAIKVI